MKRWQTLLIGLIVSAIFLFLALRQANPGQMLEALRTARYEFIVLGLVLVVANAWARGVRWSILTQNRLSVTDSFWLFNIGFLFNNVLPARLGEIARALLAGRRPTMHFTSALSSIVVERLFDLISVVALLGMCLLVLPMPSWATTTGAVVGIGSVAGIVLLAIAARWPDWMLNFSSRILALIPHLTQERAKAFLKPFVDGLGGVSDLRTFGLGAGISLISWLLSGISMWVIMLAFWTSAPVMAGMLAVAAAGLGVAVPAAPSGVGPFEAAVIGVLVVIGYDADTSRSFALAAHAVNFAVMSALGLIGLPREGVSFGEVVREAETVRHNQGDQQIARESPET